MTNDEPMTKHEWRTELRPRLRHSSFETLLRHWSFGFRHCAHHALAPIAQIRMRFARADSRPMTPAAGAFLVRRLRHRSAGFFRLLNRQITQDKKFLQFFLWDFFCDTGSRIQNHAGFQRVADHFLLASMLNRLPDDAAQSQKFLNLLDCLATTALRLRKVLKMDRGCSRGRCPRLAG